MQISVARIDGSSLLQKCFIIRRKMSFGQRQGRVVRKHPSTTNNSRTNLVYTAGY